MKNIEKQIRQKQKEISLLEDKLEKANINLYKKLVGKFVKTGNGNVVYVEKIISADDCFVSVIGISLAFGERYFKLGVMTSETLAFLSTEAETITREEFLDLYYEARSANEKEMCKALDKCFKNHKKSGKKQGGE